MGKKRSVAGEARTSRSHEVAVLKTTTSLNNGLPPRDPQENKDDLRTELWHACAGLLVYVLRVGDKVFYFPQGHMEQVAARMNEDCKMEMPIYDLPYKILCKVVHVELKVFRFHGIARYFVPVTSQSSVSEPSKSTSGVNSEKQCKNCCCAAIRSCTKVLKYGTVPGRSVDLTQFDGYNELICELDLMFDFQGSLIDETSGWYVVYSDDEGDMMQIEDCPWQEFQSTVQRILKTLAN